MLEGKVNKPTLSFMLVEQNIDSTAILQKLLANNTSAYNKRIKKNSQTTTAYFKE